MQLLKIDNKLDFRIKFMIEGLSLGIHLQIFMFRLLREAQYLGENTRNVLAIGGLKFYQFVKLLH